MIASTQPDVESWGELRPQISRQNETANLILHLVDSGHHSYAEIDTILWWDHKLRDGQSKKAWFHLFQSRTLVLLRDSQGTHVYRPSYVGQVMANNPRLRLDEYGATP